MTGHDNDQGDIMLNSKLKGLKCFFRKYEDEMDL